MSDVKNSGAGPVRESGPMRLRDALRQARIEAADRSAVIVDLRDAELARLDILNEALDPVFSQIPDEVDMFDRGISQGTTPRLWIDMVAHVVMGRDKRIYRFVQDTRHGRVVIAEAYAVPDIVEAVTQYIARRMIERDQALAVRGAGELPDAALLDVAVPDAAPTHAALAQSPNVARASEALHPHQSAKPRRSGVWLFLLGILVGAAALFGWAMFATQRGI